LALRAGHAATVPVAKGFLPLFAVLFGVACFSSFWSFKTSHPRLRQRLRLTVDTLFMAALVVMVCICAIIAYALV
jgi:hypothetical protein